MREFDISDVLSITTGRLVSTRHIDGVYDILNFLTGDELFTHQLPRASKECKPWLKTQFPYLFPDSPAMKKCLDGLDKLLAMNAGNTVALQKTVTEWIAAVRRECSPNFPEVIPEKLTVYELGADMHTHIDPIQEAQVMFGKAKVITVAHE